MHADLQALVDMGAIECSGDKVRLTKKGVYLARQWFEEGKVVATYKGEQYEIPDGMQTINFK